MKKLSKILILVLSLALVLGSIMVVSSAADVTGWTVWRDIDFTGVSASNVANNSGDYGSAPHNFKLQNYASSMGTPSLVEDDVDGDEVVDNSYWKIAISNATAGSKDVYFSKGYQNGWCGAGSGVAWSYNSETQVWTPGKLDARANPYFIYQVDVMSPTGEFTDPAWQVNYRWPGLSGSNPAPRNGMCGYDTTVSLKTDDTGSYFDVNGTKTYVNPYAFNRLTIILKAVFPDDTSAQAEMYVYVNGVFAGKGVSTFADVQSSETLKSNFSWEDVRLKPVYAGGTFVNASLALDNMKFIMASSEYDATALNAILAGEKNLKDDTTWAENPYLGAIPSGTRLMSIEGVAYDDPAAIYEKMDSMDFVEATILSDVVDFTIPKSGKVYYETAAQYEAIKTAAGYGKVQKEDASGTFAEIAPAAPKEVYYDYHWGDGCTDTHFLSAKASIPIGEKLLSQLPTDVYTLDNGLIQGYLLQGGKYVRHTGWKYLDVEIDYDDDFNEVVVGVTEGEDVALDALVTAETADVVYLKPVFTEVDASVLANALYAVAANGTYTFYDKDTTLKAAIEAAPAGSTLVLLGDVAHDPNVAATKITISKKLTIDLNGHTLDVRSVHYIARPEGATNDNANKLYAFNDIKDLTITSSALGGKIFHASAANQANSGRRVTGGFISMATGGKFAMTAQGPEYLTIYTGTVVNNYNKHVASVTYQGIAVIDNGATDNNGLLFYSACDKFTMKDCVVISGSSTVVRLDGREGSAQTTTQQTATIDNCIIIAPALTNYTCKTVDFTITNSFISGNITPGAAYPSSTDAYKGYITLGAGNYIGGNLNDRVKFADGVQKYDVTSYFQSTFKINKYSAIPADKVGTTNAIDSDLVVFDQVYSTTYKYYTGATGLADVTVNLGTTGKTATIKSGMIPSGAVAGLVAVENWVNINSVWYADYTGDAATAEVTLTESVNEYVQAFDNTVYYQFRLSDHVTLYAYVPLAPEGIEYTYAWYGAYSASRPSDRVSNNVVHIDDVEYMELKGNWNGVSTFANGQTIGIIYTYEGQEFTYTVTAKIADYANTVLKNDGERYSEEDKNYVIGLASYADALLDYKGTPNADIDKIATDYADSITLPEGFGDTAYTATDLSAYVESISLAVGNDRAKLQVTMKDASYTLSIKAANGDAINMSQVKSGDTPTAVWKSGDYYFYQLVGDLTITVSDGTNTVVAEGYTFSNYAAAVKAVDANAYALLCAMYEYGVAQKELLAAHAN